MAGKLDPKHYHSHGRPGKLEVVPTKPLLTQRDLSMAYTPGVAVPCMEIYNNPDSVFDYTAKGNLVAVVTNGSAVLGLGDIGPEASKPVMEGKANLFKKFADIDVFDIELNAKTPDEIVAAVKAIAPTFGGINLEDIKSPECFEVERRLTKELDIPVFHDDQHGTAIIATAALLNALEVSGREIANVKTVFSGAGAAALSTAKMFHALGMPAENIWMSDADGVLYKGREPEITAEAELFTKDTAHRTLADIIAGADVFVGLSVGGVLKKEMVKTMAPRPIIFAMANPDPEILPEDAREAAPDAIIATGRSDFPNQINNVLGFPFIFRGALDCRARRVTEEMKVAAVRGIAALAKEEIPDNVLKAYKVDDLSFGPEYIIPKPFDSRVLTWVAPAVAKAAAESGVARKPIGDLDRYRESLEKFVETSREFLRPLINRTRHSKKRIVFSDGTNIKVLRAARVIADEGICTPILIGPEWKIISRAEANHVDLNGVEIQEIENGEVFDKLAQALWEKRARKGCTEQRARQLLRNPVWFGCMLVDQDLADGFVGGLMHPYADTMKPALQTIGKNPWVTTVSGVYVMLFKGRHMFFGDCTVNVEPNSQELAQIAINTAMVAQSFGYKPKVAMLSFSDFGEHRGLAEVQRVSKALELINLAEPHLQVDGEVQADTAVSTERAEELFPFSKLKGNANVLIFPNLAAGNISYKLLSHLGGATAIGPLLVGLNKPLNVLALGSDVKDIVNITALTVMQAIKLAKAKA